MQPTQSTMLRRTSATSTRSRSTRRTNRRRRRGNRSPASCWSSLPRTLIAIAWNSATTAGGGVEAQYLVNGELWQAMPVLRPHLGDPVGRARARGGVARTARVAVSIHGRPPKDRLGRLPCSRCIRYTDETGTMPGPARELLAVAIGHYG